MFPLPGRCLLLLVGLLAVPLPLPAAAQQSELEKLPRVSLGVVVGTPGTTLMLPFALAGDPENPLRSLTVDISFVSKSLVFQKISSGMAAELVDAKIEAILTEGEVDEKGLRRDQLRLTASLSEPDAGQSLPDGVLAYLVFEVAEEAQPVAVKLTPTVVSAQLRSASPENLEVAKVDVEFGLITITGPAEPVIGCFFYMH